MSGHIHKDYTGAKFGMWLFLFTEVLLFGGLFLLYAVYLARYPQEFISAGKELNVWFGGGNTMVLLTSGLCAALAVQAITAGKVGRSRRWLSLTMALGLAFCVIKVMEYVDKLGVGLTPETNTFFSYYYLLTAFHLAHVIFGLGLLALAACYTSRQNVETVTAFWHMVDLIWVMLYPLLYLLR